MKILILGGDGYLGWPTAMHFSDRGDDVLIIDNFVKRRWEMEDGIEPFLPISTLHNRVGKWEELTGKTINFEIGDLQNHRFVYNTISKFIPDAIIHYGEQPSAPYSMQSRETAVYTQVNNVVGTMNIMFAIQKFCPQANLIKLGTMGEYGTPDIDIEEGWLTVNHNGRSDKVMYPKKPNSFYHLSKVHDSHNLEFACRIWGLKVTDLNQGVVYGINTKQTNLDPVLRTSFHYDDVFGTVLNRFLVQAAVNVPLSIYGKGGQTRGFLNIRDTISCVELAVDNPGEAGEFRVMNQFTEQFSVKELAEKVQKTGQRNNIKVHIRYTENPRIEAEDHYYNAKHKKLEELGLKPNFLTDDLLDEMFQDVIKNIERVNPKLFDPRIKWNQSE